MLSSHFPERIVCVLKILQELFINICNSYVQLSTKLKQICQITNDNSRKTWRLYYFSNKK